MKKMRDWSGGDWAGHALIGSMTFLIFFNLFSAIGMIIKEMLR